MPQVKDKAAREKIVRARTTLLCSNGFFGFLAMQLRLEEKYDIPTMGVDGKTIVYNPNWVHKLDERELEGVLAHEVMHCCFKHFSRRQDRDHDGWNIAGDIVINIDLLQSGFTLPKGNGVSQMHEIAQYKGMTTEEVYELLPKMTIKFSSSSGGKGDPGGCGGVMDAPGDKSEQAQTQHVWEVSVRAAIAVAKANGIGNLPGSLQRLIDDLAQPKVSWRDMTRNFIDQSMAKDVSWSRISRRSAALGTLMPGYIPDRLNHLVCVNDVSGSVSDKMVHEMVSECGGALDQNVADQMTVLYADTHVRHVDHFVPGDLVKAQVIAGGGTDFRDSFKWIRNNVPDASCVIYLTDLQVYEFGEDPGCPVLWAVFGPSTSYEHLAAKVPFGNCIHVSNSIG